MLAPDGKETLVRYSLVRAPSECMAAHGQKVEILGSSDSSVAVC
jgi:hypothetical protein